MFNQDILFVFDGCVIRIVSTSLFLPPSLHSTTESLSISTFYYSGFYTSITLEICTDPPLLSSFLPSLIHHPHVHAHAKTQLGSLCQLHMRWCHCLYTVCSLWWRENIFQYSLSAIVYFHPLPSASPQLVN